MADVELRIDYNKKVNYVLEYNRLSVCNSLEIINHSDRTLENVQIECYGEYFKQYKSEILPVIAPGVAVRIADFSLMPDFAKLADSTESVVTQFDIVACDNCHDSAKKDIVAENQCDITIMPYDQWLGIKVLPQTLVSYVTPNHPAITGILQEAANIMTKETGDAAFTAYQTGDPKAVIAQVDAVFRALLARGIVYRQAPASFEESGQRITLPDKVLSTRLGNCIELTLLMASVLESIGINTMIIIIHGHAFLGVWLENTAALTCEVDDESYIRLQCSEGIGKMIPIEATCLTTNGSTLKSAIAEAMNHIHRLDAVFDLALDVRLCRTSGIRPLPQIVGNASEWMVQDMNTERTTKASDVKQPLSYDLSQLNNTQQTTDKFDIWERKLLDFSLRNNMLNLYLRKSAIQFVSFDIDRLEDHLHDGAEFCILARPECDFEMNDDGKLERSSHSPQLKELIVDEISRKRLHTFKTEEASKIILKHIYRTARSTQEESGANSLYLAIGALRWYETSGSTVPRFAPILMLPVEMVYKKGMYHIRTREEDIMLNVTLVEFLRQNFDITIPGLNPLPLDDHGVDVKKIFAIFRSAVSNQQRWDVEEESMLGIFSFNKFLMWNDIHSHRKVMRNNPIVRSLVEQRLAWQPDELVTSLKDKDKELRPDRLALPVAVDSSQMAAVFEAGMGHSFILYGPPGTGKSQTITNLIANALFQGKRVLFVAEKMAALSVVQKRLEKVGLGPFCLEMHSNKVTKRHVLNQLALALGVTHIVSPEEYAVTAEKLYEERSKLITYLEALHDKKPGDNFSLYDCIMNYEAIDAQILNGDDVLNDKIIAKFSSVSRIDYEHMLTEKLAAVLRIVGQPSQHPLLGLKVAQGDVGNDSALAARIDSATQWLERCKADYAQLQGAAAKRAALLKDNKETIFDEDAAALRDEWRQAKSKWFVFKFFATNAVLKKMRQFNQYVTKNEIDGILDNLMEYNDLHNAITSIQNAAKQFFDIDLDADRIPQPAAIDEMIAKLKQWKNNLSNLRDWYHWCDYSSQAVDMGLDAAIAAIESGNVNTDTFAKEFFKTFFRALAMRKIAENPHLRIFEGIMFDAVVTHYRELAEKFRLLSQKELYARLAAQVPRVTDNVSNNSEIGLLNRNISNGGRGLALRDLFASIPTLMPRLCPCMLMSPMSVAQFLDLNSDQFDLVIFDEASQMPTSESVGAIARGKALIVVGDPKQMPPTSFFNSSNVTEDEAQIDDLESILEDCRMLDIPSLQLNWHYRSRHESLIAFSNNEYYDGKLITFPSTDDRSAKVRLVKVEGVYDKGGQRSNRHEARAIVDEVVRRISDPKLRADSIGIIAFSVAQQNLIEDLLQERLDGDAALQEAAATMYEPIFVKNLENVQGDERDVILFSVGYGPDKNGKVSMNFGPLNNSGGERRLNVAVSRSRKEMLVYSSLRPSDIDLNRSKAKGVAGLKHFLEFAESQMLVQCGKQLATRHDDVIAKQVAQAVESLGYNVSVGVGRSQFKIDVAVSDPNCPDKYLLGILIDGEGYRDTQTTRDREIVQPSVLTGLGWNVMRMWSVDWINNPQRVIDRIADVLKNSQNPPAPKEEPAPAAPEKFDISNEKVEEIQSAEMPYNEAQIGSVARMSDLELARKIVAAEQPITLALLCKRISRLRGMTRVTPTMQRDMQLMVMKAFHTAPDRNTRVIWLDSNASEGFAGYRQAAGRDISEIPMCEIENVVIETIKEQFSIDRESIKLIAARKLGFSRRGAKVDSALSQAVDNLVIARKVTEIGGKISLIE